MLSIALRYSAVSSFSRPLSTRTLLRSFSHVHPRSFVRPSQQRWREKGVPAASSPQGAAAPPIEKEYLFQERLHEEVIVPASSIPPTLESELSFYEKVGKPRIGRQIAFVGLLSTLAFSLAVYQTSAETDKWTRKLNSTTLSTLWGDHSITNADLKRVQKQQMIQGLRERLVSIQSISQQLPSLIQVWVNRIAIAVMQPYADTSDAKRLCWKICLLNVAVWGAWKVKSWRPVMNTSFMHNPLSGRSYTLLTSMFSHRSAMHLLFNCLALESFGAAAYYYFIREQNKAESEMLESTTSYHFLAFFITAGLFAGLVSHIASAKLLYPRIVRQLSQSTNIAPKTETWAAAVASSTANAARTAPQKVRDILPSLGASGAIYAAVTMSALAFPEAQVALFIPPSYPIDIQTGVGGLLLLDMIGILRGWRFFDHWAHLGGAAFGVIYYAYGPTYWRKTRELYESFSKSP